MAPTRFWKPTAVLCLLPLLLMLEMAAASAQAPAAGKAKVDRLVLGLMTPYLDSLRPWINGTADPNIQHDPAFEWRVEVDAETGASKPELAESWTLATDGRSWHVTLQQRVPFHHGYGAFTARDVVHTHALWCGERAPGRKAAPSSGYREGMCAVQRLTVVHDHEIVMHCKVPCLDMPLYYSRAANVMIFSKAPWEKEGEMGYERKPTGTGPYRVKEQQLSRDVLDERAPTPHWKAGVMDWHELQMPWTLEEPTRVAHL